METRSRRLTLTALGVCLRAGDDRIIVPCISEGHIVVTQGGFWANQKRAERTAESTVDANRHAWHSLLPASLSLLMAKRITNDQHRALTRAQGWIATALDYQPVTSRRQAVTFRTSFGKFFELLGATETRLDRLPCYRTPAAKLSELERGHHRSPNPDNRRQ